MAWSPDGKQLATIGRDHVIRIYEPRNSTSPINEGVGPEGSRGARVMWLSDTHLVVSGFNRSVPVDQDKAFNHHYIFLHPLTFLLTEQAVAQFLSM